MEPIDVVYDLCRYYVADSSHILGERLTNRILGYARSRSIKDLVEVSSNFSPEYHDWKVLKTLLQVEALFKKCDHFSSENCAEVAMQSFRESEEICKDTNARLDVYYRLPSDDRMVLLVQRMKRVIARTLGPIDPFYAALPQLVRATNGATATHPRSKSGGAARLKRTMYATLGSHTYLQALAAFWGYTYNFRKIHHNRVELVPKNWKTHRTIACEPEGNIALQLAFDSFCKRRLRDRLNTDLSDQSRNQELAYEGSVDGKTCTVDLKAASDRLALNVVHLLFPREWVDFFIATRSPCWKDSEGKLVPYAKLSSMGNGYTFTMETLVFAAVCKTLGSKRFSVYGDDIIIETELFGDLVELLNYLGFEVNQEKSHHDPVSNISVQQRPEEETVPRDGWSMEITLRKTRSGDSQFHPDLEGKSSTGPSGPQDGTLPDGCTSRYSPGRYSSERLADYSGHPGLCAHGSQNGPMHVKVRGVYRESCGRHFYGGHEVTPLFVRSLRTRRDWVLLVNNITSFGACGGLAWEFAKSIQTKLNLPLGPRTLDPCVCVWIDTHTCYRLGLIRTPREGKRLKGPWQPVFKGLVESSKSTRCYDSRALFLWFLNHRNEPYESSRHSLGTYKCRSKWVRFYPVMGDLMGGSVRLHWWTELLLAGDGRQ